MSAAAAWNLIAVAGAGLVGGGVWALWGAPWACILWGSLLLSLAALRGYRTGVSA